MPEGKVTVNFTMKLGGLKKVPSRDFDPTDTVGKLQRQLSSKAPLQPGGITMVYVFVDDSFLPTPDETLGNLADVFGIVDGGKRTLNLSYSLTNYQG